MMYCITKIYQKFNWTPSKGEGKKRRGQKEGGEEIWKENIIAI